MCKPRLRELGGLSHRESGWNQAYWPRTESSRPAQPSSRGPTRILLGSGKGNTGPFYRVSVCTMGAPKDGRLATDGRNSLFFLRAAPEPFKGVKFHSLQRLTLLPIQSRPSPCSSPADPASSCAPSGNSLRPTWPLTR